MTLRIFAAALLAGGVLAAGPACAQAPNLDAVPDKMPFANPFGQPISMDRANAVIAAGVAEAKKRGWDLNIAVVGPSGDLTAFGRMDNAQFASISISQHKARVAARYRRPTVVFERLIGKGPFFAYLPTLDDVIASRGGNPLVVGGKIVGAIGVSGGTGSQDDVISQAGVAALK